MVVAFTGYRPEKMPFVESKKDEAYLKFRKRQLQVIERLIERGCTHFISGVAMGFDTWVAEDILVLQKNNSSLELECAIPFPGQAATATMAFAASLQNCTNFCAATFAICAAF